MLYKVSSSNRSANFDSVVLNFDSAVIADCHAAEASSSLRREIAVADDTSFFESVGLI